MAKTIFDLKPLDDVNTKSYGPAQFIGFLGEGLECQVGTWEKFKRPDGTVGRRQINPIILVSDLILIED
jgi:hypothetical protein